MAVCNDEKQVAVGMANGHVSLLDLRIGKILWNWRPHEGDISYLKFLNGNTLNCASMQDSSYSLWNMESKNMDCIRKSTELVDIYSQDTYIFTMNGGNLFSISGIDPVLNTKVNVKSQITKLSFAENNKLFLFCLEDGSIYIYS